MQKFFFAEEDTRPYIGGIKPYIALTYIGIYWYFYCFDILGTRLYIVFIVLVPAGEKRTKEKRRKRKEKKNKRKERKKREQEREDWGEEVES